MDIISSTFFIVLFTVAILLIVVAIYPKKDEQDLINIFPTAIIDWLAVFCGVVAFYYFFFLAVYVDIATCNVGTSYEPNIHQIRKTFEITYMHLGFFGYCYLFLVPVSRSTKHFFELVYLLSKILTVSFFVYLLLIPEIIFNLFFQNQLLEATSITRMESYQTPVFSLDSYAGWFFYFLLLYLISFCVSLLEIPSLFFTKNKKIQDTVLNEKFSNIEIVIKSYAIIMSITELL